MRETGKRPLARRLGLLSTAWRAGLARAGRVAAGAMAIAWLSCAPVKAEPAGAAAQPPAAVQAKPAAGSAEAMGAEPSHPAVQAPPAEPPTEQAVGEAFSKRFSGVPVTGVRRIPYGGLYEVQVGGDLLYTDADVTFVLDGSLIDARTRRDVTRERLEALAAIDFDELPLALAIKQVKGDGSRRLAIFEDPNCGYCKQMRHTLEDVDDITLYTFLLPILTPDSHEKVRDVWCARDPGRAWDDWMLRGKVPPRADCDHPADQVQALAQRLMVRGTPALFFADGTRVSGAIPAAALRERLK